MRFVDQVDAKLRNDESIIETRVYKRNPVSYSKAACWAWDFYNLRSKIVHGDEVKPEELCYKDWVTHNIVADLVFWEFAVRELFENGCIGERARKWVKEFKPHITDNENLEEIFLNFTMGFDDKLSFSSDIFNKEVCEVSLYRWMKVNFRLFNKQTS